MSIQLEFECMKEINEDLWIVQKSIDQVKKSSDNVRRGIFARYNELCKMFIAQQEKLEQIEKKIEMLSESKKCWAYNQHDTLISEVEESKYA